MFVYHSYLQIYKKNMQKEAKMLKKKHDFLNKSMLNVVCLKNKFMQYSGLSPFFNLFNFFEPKRRKLKLRLYLHFFSAWVNFDLKRGNFESVVKKANKNQIKLFSNL